MYDQPDAIPPAPPAADLTTAAWPKRTHLIFLAFLVPAYFLTLIVIGSALLSMPNATPHFVDSTTELRIPVGEPISRREAVFTATSAACLVGLTLRDTAREFTPFGQAVIAALFQLGALGAITFGSVLVLKLLTLWSSHDDAGPMIPWSVGKKRPLLRLVGGVTLSVVLLQLIGAAMLYPLWQAPAGEPMTVLHRMGMSLFYSASAFSNAGFDITGHSLTGYRYAMLTHAVVLPLIVVGGLGFPVWVDIARAVRARARTRRRNDAPSTPTGLSAYTKLVFVTSAGLYLLGIVTISAGQMMPHVHAALEHGVTAHAQMPDPLSARTVGGVLADASFMSATSRSAGLHAMPFDEFQPAGRFSVITLMLVGGSPGSPAGGVTTWVFALIVLSVGSTLLGRTRARAFGRVIPGTLNRIALALSAYLGLLLIGSTWMLCLFEPFTFQALLFESVSASTGTGLSLGVTPDLTDVGRRILIWTMFLGRVGPMVLLSWMLWTLPKPDSQTAKKGSPQVLADRL